MIDSLGACDFVCYKFEMNSLVIRHALKVNWILNVYGHNLLFPLV